eukprot:snap_masked-scaffold_19-processed-gene-5.27-mRNA-1 protein AED:0.16 eAED:0.16 QI:0/-1/0/1/-1/1/1/0/110
MPEVIHLTNLDALNKLLEAGKTVLIDFYADWCGPCRMISPKFNDMAASSSNDNMVFAKVDVDSVHDIAQKYEIRAMPTFIALKGSETIDTVVGADPNKLAALVEKATVVA